jgi:4-amino-4-deoxy-L-arabinose transferase-like glycosyltransferase
VTLANKTAEITAPHHGIGRRIFLTVWLVYSMHTTTNVVRETYLAIALGGHGTVRVDRYLGLHPDLFAIPGRGGYINNNPGASILGAAAYAVVHPVIGLAVRLQPSIAAPKPPATYDDPRPNRTRFMNEARARGLDIVLGLAAIGIGVLLMAPLGAAATVIMYRALTGRLADERAALWWSLVYAFATPIFFRSAFLNQNVILAHCVLGAWLCLTGMRGARRESRDGIAPSTPARNLFAVGLLLGIGLLCDYSAAPFLIVFGAWIVVDGWRAAGPARAAKWAGLYCAGGLIPALMLLGYQWIAFGNPFYPAQRYMPPTEYSVHGWFGMSAPTADLLWRNLFDLRYGIFSFSPLLVAALAAPFVTRSEDSPTRTETFWMFASVIALYLFSSANQFANLQWNTGVRYMVPAVPLLFLSAVPVLRQMHRVASAAIVSASFLISAAVTMTREDIPSALSMVFREGPTLPILIVLRKMQSGYSSLSLPWFTIWILYAATAVVLWLIWRGARLTPSVGRQSRV